MALRTGSRASLVHARGRGSWCLFPGLQLDGVLVPLNYIHAYTFKHFLPVFARAWWEELVCRWLLIGPQGPGGRVMGDTGEVVYVRVTWRVLVEWQRFKRSR